MMSTSVAVEANNLRPSRVNAAGWCLYCVAQNCTAARCIDTHARTEWQVCAKCGGSEYIDGHTDPETAHRRCDCFGGLVEVDATDAEVIELNPAYVVTFPPAVVEEPTLGLCAYCGTDHADGVRRDHLFRYLYEPVIEGFDYRPAYLADGVAPVGLCAVCRRDHFDDGELDHVFVASEMARSVSDVEPWDYHAAARQIKEEARDRNPELVAYAEAHPNNPSAQWAAYGAQY
ncbi:hypothetical protein [Nocardia sp. NPDC058705]|uniref:hypothetical protein n=1 Tax=Nocardia sp. NPDC058705 TaxID=3346609 RepID=UPI0036CB6231